MIKELKGKFSLFNVYRMKALILEEQGKRKQALAFFEKALSQKAPDPEASDKIKWDYSWILQKDQKKSQSIALLDDLIQNAESDYLPSRARFWKGRIYEDINQNEKAHLTYKELIREDPLSYYGLLAHYKLKRTIHLEKEKVFYKISHTINTL